MSRRFLLLLGGLLLGRAGMPAECPALAAVEAGEPAIQRLADLVYLIRFHEAESHRPVADEVLRELTEGLFHPERLAKTGMYSLTQAADWLHRRDPARLREAVLRELEGENASLALSYVDYVGPLPTRYKSRLLELARETYRVPTVIRALSAMGLGADPEARSLLNTRLEDRSVRGVELLGLYDAIRDTRIGDERTRAILVERVGEIEGVKNEEHVKGLASALKALSLTDASQERALVANFVGRPGPRAEIVLAYLEAAPPRDPVATASLVGAVHDTALDPFLRNRLRRALARHGVPVPSRLPELPEVGHTAPRPTETTVEGMLFGNRQGALPIPSGLKKSMLATFQVPEIPVYAREFEEYRFYLSRTGFEPEQYRGKVVVDLGSGLSPFTDVMHEIYGADASGVDIIFHPEFGKNRPAESLDSGDGVTSVGNHDAVMAEARKRGLDLSRRVGASVTNLPYASGSVDAVVSIWAIAYLPREAQQRALEEALRVLKVGGKAYLSSSGNLERLLDAWGIPFQRGDYPSEISFTKPAHYEVKRVR